MINLNLDDFADYGIIIDHQLDFVYFVHRPCNHKEIIDSSQEYINYISTKFLMVKATEHHLEKHNDKPSG